MHGSVLPRQSEQGLLPAGLVEEIRALDQPPLPLGRPARAVVRGVRAGPGAAPFLRPAVAPSVGHARHPATGLATPGDRGSALHIRRGGGHLRLDGPPLLGQALGAIASYATARDVPRARVVFCDAAAYDAGYVPVEDIAGRVKVRGRGGTVLQPGIALLEGADDFPADAPILVITDAECDVLRIRREHAFLVPEGARLPFAPRGPVFRMTP